MGCEPISIPLEQNVKLSANEKDIVEDTTMYICIMGSLIYAVGMVSEFMQTPRKPHLDVVTHKLR
jgi:hypothetical protein